MTMRSAASNLAGINQSWWILVSHEAAAWQARPGQANKLGASQHATSQDVNADGIVNIDEVVVADGRGRLRGYTGARFSPYK